MFTDIMMQVAVAGDDIVRLGPDPGEDWRVLSAWAIHNAAAGIIDGVWGWTSLVPTDWPLSDAQVVPDATRTWFYQATNWVEALILHSGEALYFAGTMGAGEVLQIFAMVERRVGVQDYA
jgi:hypothetical protein